MSCYSNLGPQLCIWISVVEHGQPLLPKPKASVVIHRISFGLKLIPAGAWITALSPDHSIQPCPQAIPSSLIVTSSTKRMHSLVPRLLCMDEEKSHKAINCSKPRQVENGNGFFSLWLHLISPTTGIVL